MSYFFRRLFHLEKANPYHDELGRFTTADDAVMFVRPKWGYNDNPTRDARWAGAYAEGKRFDIRRVPNQQGGAAEAPASTAPKDFLANVAAASLSPAPASGPGVIGVAQQLSGVGQFAPGAYPNAASTDPVRAEVQARGVLSRSDIHPDYHQVIDRVVEYRDHVKATLGKIDPSDLDADRLEDELKTAGYKVKLLGDKGVNATYVVTAKDGNKFFTKLNTSDRGWGQPDGGAIEEERSYALLIEAGFGQSINPMFKVHQDVTVQAFFEDAGKLSSGLEGRLKVSSREVKQALRTHSQEIANLGVAEYLLGDGDKHRGNYNYYNGRVYGTDWSLSGRYDTFRAGAFTALDSAGVSGLNPAQLIVAAERIYKAIEASGSRFGDLSPNAYNGVATRREAAKERLDKLRRELDPYIRGGKLVAPNELVSNMGWSGW